MKIIILTGSELRHTFFRMNLALSEKFEVCKSFCEETNVDLKQSFGKQDSLRSLHWKHRNQSEKDFFQLFVNTSKDYSNPHFIKKGMINSQTYIDEIIKIRPDLIVCYGCSIIKENLIEIFKNKILNLHLGLSPFYRGTGTNFWPLVNNEPEYVGATFMYLDKGIDTGNIIYQIRSRVFDYDSPAQIGNRLICDASFAFIGIISSFNNIELKVRPKSIKNKKYYKKSDYSDDSVKILYENFKNGMIKNYLNDKINRDKKVPLIKNLNLDAS